MLGFELIAIYEADEYLPSYSSKPDKQLPVGLHPTICSTQFSHQTGSKVELSKLP
jgi:hypothetical protein